LLLSGQVESANGELRRLIEITLWCIYFTDHPIEWDRFSRDPTAGFSGDASRPITYCSRRERQFYASYAKELFEEEPSRLGMESIDQLSRSYGELNAWVHAGHAVKRRKLRPPLDDTDEAQIANFLEQHRKVCAASVLAISAFLSKRFDRLPPVHRAWFDWLVGTGISKRVRSGQFGLGG
jgi:hypothetical protein